jgi:hypothetical protein
MRYIVNVQGLNRADGSIIPQEICIWDFVKDVTFHRFVKVKEFENLESFNTYRVHGIPKAYGETVNTMKDLTKIITNFISEDFCVVHVQGKDQVQCIQGFLPYASIISWEQATLQPTKNKCSFHIKKDSQLMCAKALCLSLRRWMFERRPNEFISNMHAATVHVGEVQMTSLNNDLKSRQRSADNLPSPVIEPTSSPAQRIHAPTAAPVIGPTDSEYFFPELHCHQPPGVCNNIWGIGALNNSSWTPSCCKCQEKLTKYFVCEKCWSLYISQNETTNGTSLKCII